jgi:tetratricopeptide (TPR) repeat protein
MVTTSVNEIWELIQSPANVGEEHLNQLSDLVSEYPFCQTLQLLYIKSLKEADDVHYNERLKLSAIYASDRKILHQILLQKKSKVIPIAAFSETEFIDEKIETFTTSEEKTNALPEILNLETELNSLVEPLEISKIEYTDNLKITYSYLADTNFAEKNFGEETSTQPEPETAKEIINDAGLDKNNGDNDVSLRSTLIDEAPLEKEILSEAINKAREIYLEETFAESIKKNPQEIIPELKMDSVAIDSTFGDKKLSFSDWLIQDAFEDLAQKTTTNDLIDRFITASPQMTPPKKDFFSPTNLGKKSLLEDDTMVTETLAKIYMAQNEFDKAIKAYKTLRLKYPEKNTYFAAQIKKAQELKTKKNK